MGISVTTDQKAVHFLIADLVDAETGITDRVADVFERSGPTFVRTAKRLAPKDTHALEKSIDYTVARSIPRLRFGPMKRTKNPKSGQLAISYAGYVHDGTSRMPGRPFVTQAYERHSTDQSNFMRGLRKAGVANIGRSTGGLS